jgi:protein-ribulosamine 3-kinase
VNRPLARSIAQSISAALETPFEPLRWEPVGGGCIHQAWKFVGALADGEAAFFVKSNAAESLPMLEAEAEGLAALRRAGCSAPRALLSAQADGQAWLVLDWLDLVALDAASGARLGEALAALHAIEQPRFGWAADNFIGASPQRNGWSDDWLEFWRMRRLASQLRMAAANRLPSRLIDRGERLAADCDALFKGHAPRPSLLHGDLWGGNAAALADGTPVVFDPAVYCGDREADVAMTQLFGGFPPEFQAAYRARLPLPEGHAVRRDFYNVYHLLNHANLFAGGYVRQAQDAVERLLAEIA